MEIYETLKQDHEELKDLLQDLLAAENDERKREAALYRVRDALIPHSRAEEAVFYNSLREFETAREKIRHSYKEHMEAETMLRSLQLKEMLSADWGKTARELKAALEHHLKEEEGEVFPLAQRLLTAEESEMMAAAFTRFKAESSGDGIMKTSFDLVVNLMPPRFTARFRDYGVSERAS